MYQTLENGELIQKSGKFPSPQSIVFQHEVDHCGNGTSTPKTIYKK